MGKRAWLSFRSRPEWVMDKTCKPPSFLASAKKQLCLWSPSFLPFGTRRNMQGYPWPKKQARTEDSQSMPPPFFLLAFTRKQLCFQSPCFLPGTQLHSDGVSGSVKSDHQRHSALGPCWVPIQNRNRVEFSEIEPCLPPLLQFLYNRHQMKDKIVTRTVLRMGNGSIHF